MHQPAAAQSTNAASPGTGELAEAAAAAVPWLPRLSPNDTARGLAPASSGGLVTRATRVVGANAVQWVVELGHEVAERVAAEIPSHVPDAGFDVLRMGTESTCLLLLITLTGPELQAPVTPEAHAGIPDFVRSNVGLDELLRGIRLGHSVIAAALLTECARLGDPELRHEQMRTLSQRMFAFFDSFSTQMAAAYREEEVRWAQSEAASQLAIVEEILRTQEAPSGIMQRRLRYDLSREHVALIVWSSARTLDADQSGLHEAANELLRHTGYEQKLVLTASLGVVWAWATPRAEASSLIERLTKATLPADTHAAIGPAGRGLEGFHGSHADAQAAFAMRSKHPTEHAITRYSEVDLISLLLADQSRALRFANRELGPLAAHDDATKELRRSLKAYLDSGGSPHTAARWLAVSRNTVTYRVRKAEELLGHEIGGRRAQLQAALAILDECDR